MFRIVLSKQEKTARRRELKAKLVLLQQEGPISALGFFDVNRETLVAVAGKMIL